MTPTPEAVHAATDTYAFWLALVATPAVGNLLAALAALISAAAAYLVWRTRRDVTDTKARLDETEARLDDQVEHLASIGVHPPRRPPEAPP